MLQDFITMADIGKRILLPLLFISVCTVCIGSFHDTELKRVDKSVHYKTLFPLAADIRWLANTLSRTPRSSAEASQTLIEPLTASQTRTIRVMPREGAHKDRYSNMKMHNNVHSEGSAHKLKVEKTLNDFVKNRHVPQNFEEKVFEMSDSTKEERRSAASFTDKSDIKEHILSGGISTAERKQADNKNNVVTIDKKKAVARSEIRDTMIYNNHVVILKTNKDTYKKHNKSGLDDGKPHSIKIWRRLRTYLGNSRKKRNTQDENSNMENTENIYESDRNNKHIIEYVTDPSRNVSTMSNMANVSVNITDESGIDEASVNGKDSEIEETRNYAGITDSSLSVLNENMNTMDTLFVSATEENPILSNAAITESWAVERSSNVYNTFSEALDKDIHIPSDLPSLSESISNTTTLFSLNTNSAEAVTVTMTSEVLISSDMTLKEKVNEVLVSSDVDNVPEVLKSSEGTHMDNVPEFFMSSDVTSTDTETEVLTSSEMTLVDKETEVLISSEMTPVDKAMESSISSEKTLIGDEKQMLISSEMTLVDKVTESSISSEMTLGDKVTESSISSEMTLVDNVTETSISSEMTPVDKVTESSISSEMTPVDKVTESSISLEMTLIEDDKQMLISSEMTPAEISTGSDMIYYDKTTEVPISLQRTSADWQYHKGMKYFEISTPTFHHMNSHTDKLNSETSLSIDQYDKITPSDTEYDTLNVQISVSTTFDMDTDASFTSTTSGDLSRYESTPPDLSTSYNLAPSSDDVSGHSLVNIPAKNSSFDNTTPKFNPEVEHVSIKDDVYFDNDSVAVARAEDEYSSLPLTEAGPDWKFAKQTWQYAWEIHIYVYGGLFALVGLYTMLSFVRLWWIRCLFSSGYFISLHILLMFICFTRSVHLLYDGYGSSGTFHIGLNHFLYSIAFPCLTSAFSVLFYSLLKATHIRIVSPAIQKLQVLVFIIVVHFLISLTTDVLVGLYAEMQVMLFVSHVYFILWGLFLFTGYVCIFHKLRSHAEKRQKEAVYASPSIPSTTGTMTSSLTLSAAVKVMICIAICGLFVVTGEIYAIVGVYKTFTKGYTDPWTWWLYHTVLRLLEFVMCLTLSYVSSLPLRYPSLESKNSCGVCCVPCSEIFCCGYSINKQGNETGFNNFEQTSNFNSVYNDNADILTENSSKKLMYNQLSDTIPTFNIQSSFNSRPNSLLIIEDGYVRFQTDYDINRIVDSCNDLSQNPADVHSMSTFLRRDGVINTGYSLNSREDRQQSNNNRHETGIKNKPRSSSIANSDLFKVPSSVSLADSMENELDKAFESFKLDTSVDNVIVHKSEDLPVGSNFQNIQEVDLISITSVLEFRTKTGMASHQKSKQNKDVSRNDDTSRQLFTLPRTTKSPEVCRPLRDRDSLSDPNMQQKPLLSPLSNDAPTAKYFSLLDTNKEDNHILYSDDSDLDSELDFSLSTRRPSEGQGSQAAVLTSLLKSWESAESENIDV